jgi:shikimate kinase
MAQEPSNIVLIGMPGSGKSTVGVILAKLIAMEFVDTDLLIQRSAHRSLQDIVDKDGHLALRSMEEQILLGLHCHHHVVATGGSAVYSRAAMDHLRSEGTIVFLDVDFPTLESRVKDYETRGLSKSPDQTFKDLFEERTSLYRQYAEIIVDCAGLSQEGVCAAIIKAMNVLSIAVTSFSG